MTGVVAMQYNTGTLKSPMAMPRLAAKRPSSFMPGQWPKLSLPSGSWLVPTIALGAFGWVEMVKLALS